MNEHEKIALIIADEQETEIVDFKFEFYDTLKNSDLSKILLLLPIHNQLKTTNRNCTESPHKSTYNKYL